MKISEPELISILEKKGYKYRIAPACINGKPSYCADNDQGDLMFHSTDIKKFYDLAENSTPFISHINYRNNIAYMVNSDMPYTGRYDGRFSHRYTPINCTEPEIFKNSSYLSGFRDYKGRYSPFSRYEGNFLKGHPNGAWTITGLKAAHLNYDFLVDDTSEVAYTIKKYIEKYESMGDIPGADTLPQFGCTPTIPIPDCVLQEKNNGIDNLFDFLILLKVDITINFKLGIQHGATFVKHKKTGQKILECNYKNGKKHGIHAEYSYADGSIEREVEFENGIIVDLNTELEKFNSIPLDTRSEIERRIAKEEERRVAKEEERRITKEEERQDFMCNQLERENESGARNEIQREKLIWLRSEHNKSNRYGMTITEHIRLLENELGRLSCSGLDMRDWFIKGRKLQRLRLQTFIQQTINEIKVAKWSFKADYSMLPQEMIYSEKYEKLTKIDLDYLAPERLERKIYLNDVNALQANGALEMQNGNKLEGGFIEYNKVGGRWELTARKENGEKYQDVQEYCFDTYFDKGIAGSFNKWFLDEHIRGALADDIRRCRLIREDQIRAEKEHELALQHESENRIIMKIKKIFDARIEEKILRRKRNLWTVLKRIKGLSMYFCETVNRQMVQDLYIGAIELSLAEIDEVCQGAWNERRMGMERKERCFGPSGSISDVADADCFIRIEPHRRAHVRRQDRSEWWWSRFFSREIHWLEIRASWVEYNNDTAMLQGVVDGPYVSDGYYTYAPDKNGYWLARGKVAPVSGYTPHQKSSARHELEDREDYDLNQFDKDGIEDEGYRHFI